MPKLADNLRGNRVSLPKHGDIPLWKGPEVDGITQSLLSRFLVCRERFRLQVVYGLGPAPQFEPRLEYGNMWHVCEEHQDKGTEAWTKALAAYCRKLGTIYKGQNEPINHWYNVCKTQFPIYLAYWAKHKDKRTTKELMNEQEFSVPYKLPSGRLVKLRGKWDKVKVVGKPAKIWLQENKSKSEILDQKIKGQLRFDLQTMIYFIALNKCLEYVEKGADLGTEMLPNDLSYPFLKTVKPAGVLYNVIRRPLSGGKGSIRQHKPTKSNPSGESKEDFYNRLAGIIKEDEDTYFARWDCHISQEDCQKFEQRFLIPILEQLWDWWEFMERCRYDPWMARQRVYVDPRTMQSGPSILDEMWQRHWQHPYGVYNVLNEGGSTDLDECLDTGSEIGLVKRTNLFPELG